MRISIQVIVATATVACLSCGAAQAQSERSTFDLEQPASVQQTAFEYSDYYASDADVASDVHAKSVDAAYTNSGNCDSCNDCDNGCDSGCSSCCDLGDAWELFPETCSGIKAGGWTQMGYTNYNTGMFNNHPYHVDLHQQWFYFGREADGSQGLDFGFRMDAVYGVDGPDTQAFGNPPNSYDFGWNNGGFYGYAIPQLYADVAYGDWNLRLGHFYTIVGYEVVGAPNNFFYSHSFTFFNSEPFTHTGALASYNAGNDVVLYGGWSTGWDTGFDSFGGDTYLGGMSVALSDDVTLIYANTIGNRGFGTDQSGYSHSLVATVALTDKLNYIFQTDYTDFNGTNSVLNTIGINQYLLYTINDCVAIGGRFEWWQTKINANNDADLYELTLGLNIRPHSNLIFRPELRWDRDDDGVLINPGHNNEIGFGSDVILTY